MPPSLIQAPGHLSPGEVLTLAQQAPAVLQSSPTILSSSALGALLSASESPELWMTYENLLLSCLRTGDQPSAHKCLDRLVLRFGNDNERIMALRGLVKEAEAKHPGELEAILNEYGEMLGANDTNIPITKRRIALLRSMGRFSDAAAALVQLLDLSPTDAEAWSELSDVYLSQGMYPQAIFAQEEVLILAPNAWNIHARLGEMLYMAATADGVRDVALSRRHLAEALKRFCRSIELCDDYLRGYYGLKLVTAQLLSNGEGSQAKQTNDADGANPPDRGSVERLNELATARLSEIVRRYSAQESGWRGYSEAEIAAARDVLSKDAAPVTK